MKALPRAFSGDAERLGPFHCEARTLASLENPKTVTSAPAGAATLHRSLLCALMIVSAPHMDLRFAEGAPFRDLGMVGVESIVPSAPGFGVRGTPRTPRQARAALPGDEFWADEFDLPVPDGWINCVIEYQDQIIVGGRFSRIGGVHADNVARWDGSRWSAMAFGMDNDVLALAVFDGAVIAGGVFTKAGVEDAEGVARWNGTDWEPMGGGLAGARCLAVYQGELIAGGDFNQSAGIPLGGIARWNGTTWVALGEGTNGVVEAIAPFNGDLFVGGFFDSAGAISAHTIAKWDGSTWSDVGGGITGNLPWVYALETYDNRLFVGGEFEAAGGVSANNLAVWDGSTWETVGSGLTGGAFAFAVHDGTLFISGSILKLVSWTPASGIQYVAGYLDGSVTCLLHTESGLLVGGALTAFNLEPEPAGAGLVRWEAGTWRSFETWTDNMHGLMSRWGGVIGAKSLAAYHGNIVASGIFNFAGNPPGWESVNSIAQWDGTDWSSLPYLGYYATVEDLLARGDTLYAAGSFPGPSGYSPTARLTGSEWTLLDTLSIRAQSMAVYRGEIYIGGWRLGADSPRNGGVYRFNGATWDAVGLAGGSSEFPGVLAVAVFEDRLIVGGHFSEIGGVEATNVAAWDGSTWSPLGTGLESPLYDVAAVYALTVHGAELVAAGDLGTLGSVAVWNGFEWQPLGYIRGVHTVESVGDNLFAGGWIHNTSGEFDGLRRWTGSEWEPLGSGTNGAVSDIVSLDERLFVAGGFSEAGGHGAYGIARWDGLLSQPYAPPHVLSPAAPNPFRETSGISYSLSTAGQVRAGVFDSAGRQVQLLKDGFDGAGPHQLVWNGRDARGRRVPAGLYFIHVRFPDGSVDSRKAMLLK